jgi:hypothetical protein
MYTCVRHVIECIRVRGLRPRLSDAHPQSTETLLRSISVLLWSLASIREGPGGELADALTRRAEEIADTFGEQEISNTVISGIHLWTHSSAFFWCGTRGIKKMAGFGENFN